MLRTLSLSVSLAIMPLLALTTLTFNAYALQFSNASPILSPQQSSVTIKVLNESDRAAFITLTIEQLSSPLAEGMPIKQDSEILTIQKKFVLSSKELKPIVLQYRGPQDNKERYYRISWQQQFLQLAADSSAGHQVLPLTVDTLLIINPRKDNFRYVYNKGVLRNSGNSSFMLSAYGKCAQQSSKTHCQQHSYLLPGESSRFKQLDMRFEPSYITINYNNRYLSVH